MGNARLLVIFDLDDTLIESHKTFEPHEDAFLRSHGLVYTWEEKQEKFVGAAYSHFMNILRDDFNRLHGRDLPEDFEQGLHAAYRTAIESGFELTAGTPGFLEWLRDEKIAHCVASNSPRRSLPRKLETSGLHAHFNFHAHAGPRSAFCLDDVQRGKPAPDIHLLAAREMGGYAPDECIVVEDSAPGIQAGLAAGMFVIGFAGAHGRAAGEQQRLQAAGAHITVTDMAEIRVLLEAGGHPRRAPFAAPQ